MDNFFH